MAILQIQHIVSLDQPELGPYRTMRRSAAHELDKIFVAEGMKVVTRLLESDFPVVSVLFPERWLAEYEPLIKRRPEKEIPVYIASEKEMVEKLTGYSLFQGVLAVGRIPDSVSLEKIVAVSTKPRLLVAIDELANAENIGALVRNCVAFGVQGLIIGETSSSPFLRRSVRNSMGTIFKLPVLELRKPNGLENAKEYDLTGAKPVPQPCLAETLRKLSRQGIRCIAAHPRDDAKSISRADFTGDCCIVFGSEGDGISPEVLAACDEAVAIPMPATVDSLNVGGAAAVFLYEAARQRGRC